MPVWRHRTANHRETKMLTGTRMAGRPGSRQFQSRDPDEVVDFVSRSLSPHRMNIPQPKTMAARLECFDMLSSQIVDIQYGTDVWIEAGDLNDHYLVHAAISGTTHIWTDGNPAAADSNNLYITSPGCSSRIHMAPDGRNLAVRVPAAAFDDHLARYMNIPVGRPLIFYPGAQGSRELPAAWRQLLRHMIDQSRLAPGVAGEPRVQRHYSMLMLEMLLSNYCNSYSDQIALSGNDIAPRHVRKARDLIHASIEESISVHELALQVGVSARSLRNGFRQFLGVTPAEYVRRHRLERLHHILLEAPPEVSITEMMLKCGIFNFGRYASYYRQHYGCRPSDTLRGLSGGGHCRSDAPFGKM